MVQNLKVESAVQLKFISELKNKLAPNLVLVDVISDELNISTDSAYRRIRGETSLAMEELKHLCQKFGISLDAVFSVSSDVVLFRYKAVKPDSFDYNAWFGTVIENLNLLASFEQKEIIYGAKDIPMFYFFIMPRLAAFKLFFWMRNINMFPGMEEMLFKPEAISAETLALAKKAWHHYLPIPSIEIWSEEAITITLRQIEYYYQSDRFHSKSNAIELLEDFKSVINHVMKQAEVGFKFHYGKEPDGKPDNYQLYMNEVVILDNTVYFRMGDLSMVHLGHNVMNIISTTDPGFCRDTYNTLHNLRKNSTLISTSAEKERNRFFNSMLRRIDASMQKIL
jgi:hypothetical protein